MRFDINPADKGSGFVVTVTDDAGKVVATKSAKDMDAALAVQKAQHKKFVLGEEDGDVS